MPSVFAFALGAPLWMVMALPIGFARLFTAFGTLYALPFLVLGIAAHVASKRKRFEETAFLVLSACIGQWLLFISWLSSFRTLLASESTREWSGFPSVARSGFPIRALELPVSPMGSDTIPFDMWPDIFLNITFWFAVGGILAAILLSVRRSHPKSFPMHACLAFAGAALLYNLALFVIWFD